MDEKYKLSSDGKYMEFSNAGGITRLYVDDIVKSELFSGKVKRFDTITQHIYFNKPLISTQGMAGMAGDSVKYGETEVPMSMDDFHKLINNNNVTITNPLQMVGGTTKKRHFRKSKKSKRTKSKSRTRRGGVGELLSEDLWKKVEQLQKKLSQIQDIDKKEKFIHKVFNPAVNEWKEAQKAEAGAPASAAEEANVYDGGRRSRRIATKNKYRKVRKSRRVRRRHSRKH
jgi:hypothetical protein